MSLFKSIREMDQRFSWSFLGFMLAAILGSVTVYLEFIKENKPNLKFIITANSSVLDIREKLGSLDVLYHGESLSNNKKDLRLITIEVINQGDTAILSNFYDTNDPVGFSVVDGNIADEPLLIDASNSYLEKKLIIEKRTDDSVFFSNVILEPGEFFTIKILVLHEVSKDPTILSFGKIAGVNAIEVFADLKSSDKRSFVEETFGGGVYPNAVRFIAFGVAFVFAFVLVMLASEKIDEIRRNRKKLRLINVFKEYDTDKVSEKDNFFFDYYLSRGVGFIEYLHALLGDQERLNAIAQGKANFRRRRMRRYELYDELSLFAELKNEGLVTVDDGVVTVDQSRYSVLTDFYNYLKRKGELRRERFTIGQPELLMDIEAHNKSLKPDADEAGAA